MGVPAPLGKRENLPPPLRPDCDMRRVLITQMGLVTMVLLAPATMEDQKLTMMVLSAGCQQSSRDLKCTRGGAVQWPFIRGGKGAHVLWYWPITVLLLL